MGYSPWGRKESDMTEATQHVRLKARLWVKPGAWPAAGFPRLSSPSPCPAGLHPGIQWCFRPRGIKHWSVV